MVDPRIYRACLVLVAFAVILFGFSLQSSPSADMTTLATGSFFSTAHAKMQTLARAYPDRQPGSRGDRLLASEVAQQLSQAGEPAVKRAFQVRTTYFTAATAVGNRQLETVTATRVGLGSGTIVVLSNRDATGSTAAADMSGTAVLLELAQALSGQTLQSSVVLVSTSGQVGAAGAAQLARSLTGQPVGAVIVLGNLAGASIRQPLVVPFSDGDRVAPAALDDTLARFVTTQSGLPVTGTGFPGQVARLAFPFTITSQGPFAAAGIPAVLLSLSGDRLPSPSAAVTSGSGRIAALGTAVLQTVDALASSPSVGSPAPYLVLSGKIVPEWAVRLLVLALLLPVGATTIDSLARTRRRGHAPLRWIVWVLAGVVPFLVGLAALIVARLSGVLTAPPGAVAGGVAIGSGGAAVMIGVALVVVLAFLFLRPVFLRLAAGLGERVRPETPAADAAAVALSIVMCLLAFAVWAINPFAAALLVPALHVWLWLAAPSVRGRRWMLPLVVMAFVLPVGLLLVYYSQLFGLSPLGLVWSLTLMVAGGAMPVTMAVCWSIALGCTASALVLARRSVKAATLIASSPAPVTVRGPVTYAGPGSLGGTESAIRR